jgi:hypothetical protein
MELITLANGKLEISPYALSVKEFKAIWDRDVSVAKDRAVAELSFIYFMTDYKSVYRGYETVDKFDKICNDLSMKMDITDNIIQSAISKYSELQYTPTMRLLMDMESCLGKIGVMFRTYNPIADEGAVKFKALIASMKSVDGIVKGINSLKQTVETEIVNSVRARGGHLVGRRELPKDRRKKENAG